MFNAQIFYPDCLGVSSVISAQFTLEIVLQCEITKILLKRLYFGGLGSSMLVPPESSPAVLVIISNKSVFICNCSHVRRTNDFLGRYSSLMP